jgi:hypothetical protein
VGGDSTFNSSPRKNGQTPSRLSTGAKRDPVCTQERLPLERYAPAVQLPLYLLAEVKWDNIFLALLTTLNEQGRLEWDHAFLEGSFAPAKKGPSSRADQKR